MEFSKDNSNRCNSDRTGICKTFMHCLRGCKEEKATEGFMASLPQSYQCKRRVEEGDHDIGYGQVHNEQAGGGVHALGLDDNVTDQDVAKEGEDDDEGVCRDEQGFHCDAL